MIVCNCFDVNEKKVRELIDQGCTSPDDIAEKTYAGLGCGICMPALKSIIEQRQSAIQAGNYFRVDDQNENN